MDYPEATRLIDESFGRFSPRVAEIAGGFFAERRIDAEPRSRQARRRLLRPGRPGRLAVHPHELHRPHGRRDDAGPRAGPRHALHARRRRADGPVVRDRPRAGRGALDVRRADRLRPPDGGRDRPRHPPGPGVRARGGLVRHGLPPDRADALRAARLRPARRGRHAHRRAALGDLVRGERQVLRRRRRPARAATGWGGPTSPTSSTRASTPTPTSSRTSRRWRSTPATASGAPRSATPTSGSWRPGGSAPPAELLGGARAWTWRTRTCGSPASARWSGWWRWPRPDERRGRAPWAPGRGSVDQPFEAFLEALSGLSAFCTCSGSSPIG